MTLRTMALVILCARFTVFPQQRFSVTAAPGMLTGRESGRMMVVLTPGESPDPASTIGSAEPGVSRVFARDADGFGTGSMCVVAIKDEYSPHDPLPCDAPGRHDTPLPPGEYSVQAVFDFNRDLKGPRSPGNLYSAVRKITISGTGGEVPLELTGRFPPDELPPESEYVKYVKIRSRLLSKFHRRPIFIRAGVILPRDFAKEPGRRYPLRVSIGGYGAPYDRMQEAMREGSRFRKAWLSDTLPRMIGLFLDGRGPYGDPYQVNSANNGPYGDAVVTELIPDVEKRFRGIGSPDARFLEGASTGGWVSLALQVFYPDSFNGTWSQSPDGVDFRAFQLVNIYADSNAFVNARGFERPAAREVTGEVLWTMRHEVQVENVIGAGNSYTMSGGQWGAWNAVYGGRGSDGRPVALWDPHTGVIDRSAAREWKRYDLRKVLEENWKTLGPKLRGKIHVWVGDADDYFLNNGVHLLDNFLSAADPPAGGWIRYGPGKGHVAMPMSMYAMMKEMQEAYEHGAPGRHD